MRKLTFFAVLLVLVLGASFVAAQDDLSSVDPSGQSITYWHQYGSGAQLDTMTALVEDFNANNEWGITVEAISQGGYNDIRNLMSAAITSGDLPNLVAGYQNDAESWYLDGAALDLNPYFNDETWGFGEEASDLNQGILDFNIINLEPFNGAMLAWPNQVSANMLSVNLDMLAEAGFDGPPETFEDFKAIACA
ncbi:MAG: extracellular solute-binding protein, partial [Anaerolineae bacterium]|nr:extracellular solute-binding protein [Anaerolineae bacterium]